MLRRRVAALPGVHFTTRALLSDPSDGAITGVRLRHRETGVDKDVLADLVVDAGGRGTRTPHLPAELDHRPATQVGGRFTGGLQQPLLHVQADFQGCWCFTSIGNEPPKTTRGGALIQLAFSKFAPPAPDGAAHPDDMAILAANHQAILGLITQAEPCERADKR